MRIRFNFVFRDWQVPDVMTLFCLAAGRSFIDPARPPFHQKTVIVERSPATVDQRDARPLFGGPTPYWERHTYRTVWVPCLSNRSPSRSPRRSKVDGKGRPSKSGWATFTSRGRPWEVVKFGLFSAREIPCQAVASGASPTSVLHCRMAADAPGSRRNKSCPEVVRLSIDVTIRKTKSGLIRILPGPVSGPAVGPHRAGDVTAEWAPGAGPT